MDEDDRIASLLAALGPGLNVPPPGSARSLLSAAAVRERAQRMLDLGLAGGLQHFTVDLDRMAETSALVVRTIRANYPNLDIPLHARWRHFEVGGVDRWQELSGARGFNSAGELARAAFDLAILGVLLDAGTGGDWTYADPASGELLHRSEGLAVASLAMFASGLFSGRPEDPLRADAAALATLTADELAAGFQAGSGNALAGLAARRDVLVALGRMVAGRPEVFALADDPRPGGLFDLLASRSEGGYLPAPAILERVLDALGPIWSGPVVLDGIDLGDSWRHPALVTGDGTSGIVPLHTPAQWLSLSLIEPLGWAGIKVTDVDGLTGLADVNNCSLFVDTGVLGLKEPADAGRGHALGSTLVVEWRALTVALLDRIAGDIRTSLYRTPEALPLARIMQGGTFAAGRALARERRPAGGPPILVDGDGTIF